MCPLAYFFFFSIQMFPPLSSDASNRKITTASIVCRKVQKKMQPQLHLHNNAAPSQPLSKPLARYSRLHRAARGASSEARLT